MEILVLMRDSRIRDFLGLGKCKILSFNDCVHLFNFTKFMFNPMTKSLATCVHVQCRAVLNDGEYG